MDRQRVFLHAALIIILGIVIYANSLEGGFIWDDNILVRDNTFIKSWSHLPEIFTKDLGAGSGVTYNFYRPIFTLSLLINHSISGLDVTGYHLTNILLHILVALSIYWLITILFKDRLISLLTSILFIAHPVHSEVVANITVRGDALAALFVLLTLITYIKFIDGKKIALIVTALFLYTLALLSKENALILPLLLLLYHYAFGKRMRFWPIISFVAISCAYVLLRLIVLKSLPLPSPSMVFQRIPGFFVAVLNYIRLLTLPLGLHIEYGDKIFSPHDIRAIGGVILSAALLVYSLKLRKRNNLFFFSILWFFITLMPFSNIYPIGYYMIEHGLYLPSIGFMLIISLWLSKAFRHKRLKMYAASALAILIIIYGSLTIRHNIVWSNPMSFYKSTLNFNPFSSFCYSRLGNLYYDSGKKEKAIDCFVEAIKHGPNKPFSYYNLANIYKEMGNTKEAILLYRKAIELKPDYAMAYNNLGIMYGAMGIDKKAIPLFERAIELNPNLANPYYNLALIYKEAGREEEANSYFSKAIELNPACSKKKQLLE